jgi:UPF0755 protein
LRLKKVASIASVVVVFALIVYGYLLYKDIFSSNTSFKEQQVFVYIPTGSGFDDAVKIISPYLENPERFVAVAQKKAYPEHVKAGKFLLRRGMNSNDIVNALRQNVPVKLSFNNQERVEDLAGRISHQLECDSISLYSAFTNENFLEENGFNRENVLSLFIPNSYEFYWNTDAEKFLERMAKEYRIFWTQERIAKAEEQGLTPLQVSVLASIVHKETVQPNERPRVAGVYLNRLKKGMKLEADPTVIYAIKKESNDFDRMIKRVLYKDLETQSPYNTYRNEGLPPGPIAMPDISAIDAVLNPEQHSYIYFCASVERFGYHEFAVTLAQHEANRRKYVKWINAQGIKR